MSYENKPYTGALFKNEYKQNEKHPDYKGKFYVSLDGQIVEFELAAWIKESKNGTRYMSLSAGEKRQPRERRQEAPAEDLDGEIPF